MSNWSVSVIVADDHPLIRQGLRVALSRLGEGTSVAEAGSLNEVDALLSDGKSFDLLLLDLNMPGMDGVETVAGVKARYPKLPVVILSAEENADVALRALRLGAAGFVPKSSPAEVMLAALRLTLSGGTYVPPLVADHLAHRGDEGDESPLPTHVRLTARQEEVLGLMEEGMANKEIATRLGLSEATVKVHVTAILKAYGVSSRAKAVRAALAVRGQNA